MIKGKVLKDTDDMAKVGFANNMVIMMMGTAEDKGLKEPTQAIKFFEDMTPEEKANVATDEVMDIYNKKYGQKTFFDEIWARDHPEEAQKEQAAQKEKIAALQKKIDDNKAALAE